MPHLLTVTLVLHELTIYTNRTTNLVMHPFGLAASPKKVQLTLMGIYLVHIWL